MGNIIQSDICYFYSMFQCKKDPLNFFSYVLSSATIPKFST